MEKKTNSKLIGSAVFTIFFLVMGMVNLVIKKTGYVSLVYFAISIVSLIIFLYLLKVIKNHPNEKYDDERSQFISEKSSSMSFHTFIFLIIVFKILIHKNIITVGSELLLTIILGIAIIINILNYFICKLKY